MIEYITNPKLDLHRDAASELYLLKKGQVTKDVRYWAKNFFVFAQFYGDWYKNCAPRLWEGFDKMNLKTADGMPLKKHLELKGITRLGACHPEKKPLEGTFEKVVKKVEHDFWYKKFEVYTKWKYAWTEAYVRNGYFKMLTGFIVQGDYDRKQILNYPIQGTAFHWLLWSLIRIQKLLNKYRMKSLIVGQIHDSIIGDVHKKEKDDYLDIVKQVIHKDIRKHRKWIIVPLTVEAEIAPVGKSWYEKKEIKI